MSQFTQFKLMDLNSEEDSIKIIQEKNVCLCCLANNVELVSLATCKHTSFFELFFKFKFQYQNSVICHGCHHLLDKIERFKLQVENCINIFCSEQTLPADTLPKKFQNLISTDTQFTNSTDVIDVKPILEETKVTAIANPDHNYFTLGTEIKVEYDSSDTETALPLSEIKKEIKKGKCKKDKSPKKADPPKKVIEPRTGVDEMYSGKIVLRNLDREELMMERERDALKDVYLKLPYKCEYCIVGFDHEINYTEHMEKRHTEVKGGYVCDVCKSVFTNIASFKEHTKKHFRRYECLGCGKRAMNKYTIAEHYKNHHGSIGTTFSCNECEFTTDSHRRYRYHRDKHRQRPTCEECGNTFTNRSGLKVHMFTVHGTSGRVYACATCDKVYRTKSGLAAHEASAHSKSLPAYCTLCKTHFRTEQRLVHHLKTHSAHISENDKRFTCDECGARFLTRPALQEHTDFVHLQRNNYECDKCFKVFKNGPALKRHVNYVHQKLRPPRNKICDHCGQGFTTLTILRSHVRTHTGERPLQCPKCPATFAHSSALYTHNKLLHTRTRTQN